MADDRFGLIGHLLEGKYSVERVVAEGGFGLVYQATHRTLRKAIAVKVLKVPEALNDEARAEFLRGFEAEAQTIARLKHPAVVPVIDFGVSVMPKGASAPWMVLDWVEGEPLSLHLKARRAAGVGRSPAEALALVRPVFEALAEAHELGIVHRDVKPANVMVVASSSGTQGGGRGIVGARLFDFGIAKIMEPAELSTTGDTVTNSLLVAFSLNYAAPEQVSAMKTGPWTDVHALGLLLTQVLVDAPPYAGRDAMEIQAQVLSPSRPTPAAFGVNVGVWERVIARALSRQPGERYPNAGAFLAALELEVPAASSLAPRGGPSASTAAPGAQARATAFPPLIAATTAPSLELSRGARTSGGARGRGMAIGLALAAVLAGGALVVVTRDASRARVDARAAGSSTGSAPRAAEASSAPAPAAPAPAPAPAPPLAVVTRGDGPGDGGVDASPRRRGREHPSRRRPTRRDGNDPVPVD